MPVHGAVRSCWWLIRKDLTREVRAQQMWPGMLLLGLGVVLLLAAQVDLPTAAKTRVVGGLLWLAIFFAGTLALERSLAGERDAGCWEVLRLCPIAPSVVYLAKLAVNLVSLVVLEALLIPAFVVLTDVALLERPGPIVLIVTLADVGFVAVGTLVSGLTAGLRRRGGLLALLLLPLVAPVVLGAAEATRLVLAGQIDPLWWRWIQLLAIFATAFIVIGALTFEFVMEE
jgi:heme exporter protein B